MMEDLQADSVLKADFISYSQLIAFSSSCSPLLSHNIPYRHTVTSQAIDSFGGNSLIHLRRAKDKSHICLEKFSCLPVTGTSRNTDKIHDHRIGKMQV